METKEKGLSGMSEKKPVKEVVLEISHEEFTKHAKGSPSPRASTESSPEVSGLKPSANLPPKIPTANEAGTLNRRKSLQRSVYSKPKSRFGEQPLPVDDIVLEENIGVSGELGGEKESPISKVGSTVRNVSITPKTPLRASPGGPGGDDYEEIYKKVELSKERRRKKGVKIFVEWAVFLCLIGLLAASLTVNKLERYVVWGLEVWKWCVMVMVIFCGLYITSWYMLIVVFLIERNFMLQKKVLYFVHGLRKSVQVSIWFALVISAWASLFNRGVKRSKTADTVLDYVTWSMISLLIGSLLWVLKTLFIKILAINFHVKTFFDRIQESVFHQYVLQTLSGPPLVEEARRIGAIPSAGHVSFTSSKKSTGAKEKKVIEMGKVHELKREKITAWNMKLLVDAVMKSGLSTFSNTLEESIDDAGTEQTDQEISNEMEAKAAAYRIFKNVAQLGYDYIDEEDLLRFMIREEVDLVFRLFEGVETGRIYKKDLVNWVIKVHNERKALAHALSDTKTAVKQLNKILTGIVVVVTLIVWLLLTGIATTKVLLFLSSQILAAAFLFGNTCKTAFEAIVFVFIMHPFDVGDRCVVDGVALLVEEMNILTTVFLKLDNEKVFYPNSVLATKPISNYYRSPDMGETIEFSIDFRTPIEKIGLLKDRIKWHLEENSLHWHPTHTLVVKEMENMNKIKMALYSNHTMNFQNYAERNNRRTELAIQMKKIFEELEIKYDILPQEVLLRHIK